MISERTYIAVVLLLGVMGSTGVHAQLSTGNITAVAPVRLASYPQGQAMMAEAVQKAALLDVRFRFLDKEYENNTYATDPLGNKYITGCYRFKASSGFSFKVDQPQFTLNNQGLTVTQNIASINANGLNASVRVVACQNIPLASFGLRLTNVQVRYRVNPMLVFNQANGGCGLGWSQPDMDITIGDLNMLGVQNNIDGLAKKAVQEALNVALDGFFGSTMRGELVKITSSVCGAPIQPGNVSQPAQTTQQPAQQAPATRQRTTR
jgi:hypothetical protein